MYLQQRPPFSPQPCLPKPQLHRHHQQPLMHRRIGILLFAILCTLIGEHADSTKETILWTNPKGCNKQAGAKTELLSSKIFKHTQMQRWMGGVLKGLLTRTKINLQPSLWNYETCYFMSNMYASGTLCHRDSWTKHNSCLIIHPPSKFAFCEIAKNGCSQWTTVLAKLFYDNINIKFSHFDLSLRSFEKYGIEGLNSIFSDPDATKVVMIRDPLARFASAYLDK